nr:hypothetical protein [Tanacetum cinerariifolium]
MILGIQTTDPSPRPTLDFTAKLFSNMKLNWDGPHMPLLAPMLVGPAGGDSADAVAAGAAVANEVRPPSPPPDVPSTHTFSSTLGPSTATQDTPVRDPTPVREPTPSPVREPTPFQEPTPDSPRPPSPLYPISEEVGPTTSTGPPSPTRQTSFQEDISEGGGDYVSSPKSNEAPPTTAATAAGGAEDSGALTDLSFKLDRCINRVTTLENELGVTKKVLGGKDAATKEQDIDLDALHKLASTSLGGDTTVEAAYTIYKASQAAHASSDPGHDEDEVPDDATMPFRHTIPAGDGIPANAQTIPAGSTPIPSSGGVSTGSSMDPAGQATVVAPSSTIPAADKGKAPMLGEDLAKKLHAEQKAEFARQQEELAQKAQAESVASPAEQGDDVNDDNINERLGKLLMRKRRGLAEQSQVSASVSAAPSTAAAVSVPAAPSIPADVSDFVAPYVHADTEVDAAESRLDDTQTASEHVSTEHIVDESTPSSSRSRRKHISKKRVTPIVDVADDALIKFDSASESDDDPLPYAPYAGWEMVSTPLGSIHAYYDIEEHTKHFTSLCELLHMVEKNDLRKLLGAVDNLYQREKPDTFALILWGDLRVLFQSLADEDTHAFWRNQDSWRIRSWRLYPRAQV